MKCNADQRQRNAGIFLPDLAARVPGYEFLRRLG